MGMWDYSQKEFADRLCDLCREKFPDTIISPENDGKEICQQFFAEKDGKDCRVKGGSVSTGCMYEAYKDNVSFSMDDAVSIASEHFKYKYPQFDFSQADVQKMKDLSKTIDSRVPPDEFRQLYTDIAASGGRAGGKLGDLAMKTSGISKTSMEQAERKLDRGVGRLFGKIAEAYDEKFVQPKVTEAMKEWSRSFGTLYPHVRDSEGTLYHYKAAADKQYLETMVSQGRFAAADEGMSLLQNGAEITGYLHGQEAGQLAPQVSEQDLEQVIGAGELQDPETERLADIEDRIFSGDGQGLEDTARLAQEMELDTVFDR